ncbi:MAG: OmpP1/FadL family transporter [Gammaproteobacteria bacterium]
MTTRAVGCSAAAVLGATFTYLLIAAVPASAQADAGTTRLHSQFEGPLLAWQNPGEDAVDQERRAAGARAITPRMIFAAPPSPEGQSESGDSGYAASSDTGGLHYAFPFSEKVELGFRMDAGGFGASALPGPRSFNLAPSLGYSVNESLAVSIGIDTAFFNSARSAEFNQFTDCVALEERGELPLLTCSDAIAYTPANLARGRAGALDADGLGYGYNLGATLLVTDSTRLGMRYQSGMQLSTEDETVFHTAGPLLSTDLARLTDQAVIAGLGLPGSFAVGASHQFNDRWSVAGDVTWVNWRQFDDLRILSDGARHYGGATTENWENTYRYTLGLNYRQSDRWKYRLGAAYDQSPLPSSELGNGLVPKEDLVWIALGVGYSPTPRLSFDVGYAYPFLTEPQLYNGLQRNLAGQFEGESDILSAQFKWRFE